jgi:hypothetical protein
MYKLEDKYNDMKTAVEKYNVIGDMMARRNENPIVLKEPAASRFIQSAARYKNLKKALQSKISDLRTRSNLPQSQTQQKIREAGLGIQRMDNNSEEKKRKKTAGTISRSSSTK